MLDIGAHASIAGGVHNAVEEQLEYGGTCGQIFTHSPQVWQDPDIGDLERCAAGPAFGYRDGPAVGPGHLSEMASPNPVPSSSVE